MYTCSDPITLTWEANRNSQPSVLGKVSEELMPQVDMGLDIYL